MKLLCFFFIIIAESAPNFKQHRGKLPIPEAHVVADCHEGFDMPATHHKQTQTTVAT